MNTSQIYNYQKTAKDIEIDKHINETRESQSPQQNAESSKKTTQTESMDRK